MTVATTTGKKAKLIKFADGMRAWRLYPPIFCIHTRVVAESLIAEFTEYGVQFYPGDFYGEKIVDSGNSNLFISNEDSLNGAVSKLHQLYNYKIE